MTSSAHQFQGREMQLAELCAKAGVARDVVQMVRVTDVTADSREVGNGSLFVAVAGEHVDGHDFVPDAVNRGASAVVVEREVFGVVIPQIVVNDSGGALGRLAAHYYGVSGDALTLVGVTGTNGKSTTCAMIQAMFRASGRRAALLGTIEYDLVGRRARAPWTTPPAVELCRLLAEAKAAGADSAVMEVSSHALSQGRVAGLSFDGAVFTNLTRDHLDYHADFAAYLSAKKRLFDSLDADGSAVVNGEDASAGALMADCAGRISQFGIDGDSFDYRGVIDEEGLAVSRFALVGGDGRGASLATRLIGRHNVMNALGAAAICMELGIDIDTVRRGLAELPAVRGRLELVTPADWPFAVFVDYAHTDDALSRVCAVLRRLTSKRLIVVFGCGGDRDRAKRPMMAAAVARFADVAVVTSDNPRSEDPSAIIEDIRVGFGPSPRCGVVIEEDRRRAIELAIGLADAGDAVLVAGKGHEDYQIVGAERRWFDDAVVVGEVIGM